MEKQDFFKILIDKGKLKTSGLDKDLIPYRIIEYQGKDFKLILKETEPDYKKGYNILMGYWDSLPEEEQIKIDKQLKKLNL